MRDSELLSRCLVDGDQTAMARARRRRRRALLIAVAIEGSLLAAILLAPLATSSVPPKWVLVAPSAPYRGRSAPTPEPRRGNSRPKHRPAQPDRINILKYQPLVIPHHVSPGANNESPLLVGSTSDNPPGISNSNGPIGVPFGESSPPAPAPPPPVAVKREPRRVHCGGAVEEALLIHRVIPVYPPLAVQLGLAGTVRLHAIIGTDGTIRELAVENGHALLVKAALDAVRQWRYRPTRLNGEAVDVETTITVIFELNR